MNRQGKKYDPFLFENKLKEYQLRNEEQVMSLEKLVTGISTCTNVAFSGGLELEVGAVKQLGNLTRYCPNDHQHRN